MSEYHSSTAIAIEFENIHSFSLRMLQLDKVQILVPFVTNDLAAGETSNGDDHVCFSDLTRSVANAPPVSRVAS